MAASASVNTKVQTRLTMAANLQILSAPTTGTTNTKTRSSLNQRPAALIQLHPNYTTYTGQGQNAINPQTPSLDLISNSYVKFECRRICVEWSNNCRFDNVHLVPTPRAPQTIHKQQIKPHLNTTGSIFKYLLLIIESLAKTILGAWKGYFSIPPSNLTLLKFMFY